MVPVEFIRGMVFRRKDIHNRYGGRRRTRISPAEVIPCVFLFARRRDKPNQHIDGYGPDGFYHYAVQGYRGSRRMPAANMRIAKHAEEGRHLMLFEPAGTGQVRYVGRMQYVDFYTRRSRGKDDKAKDATVFRLAPALDWARIQPTVASHHALAYQDMRNELAKKARPESIPEYIEEVRKAGSYVFGRANGFCEGCGQPAPFEGALGFPHLELHNALLPCESGVRLLPYTLALCPVCHARAHHGMDSAELNLSLLNKARQLDEAACSGKLTVTTAAVIEDGAGHILIAQRPAEGAMGGKWEFPGGKADPHEDLPECLRREICEELGVVIDGIRPFFMVDHAYPGFLLRLHGFLCRIAEGEIRLQEHQAVSWVRPCELLPFDLAAADIPLAAEVVRAFED